MAMRHSLGGRKIKERNVCWVLPFAEGVVVVKLFYARWHIGRSSKLPHGRKVTKTQPAQTHLAAASQSSEERKCRSPRSSRRFFLLPDGARYQSQPFCHSKIV